MQPDPVTLRDLALALLICTHAAVRAVLISTGWHYTRAGRRIYR